MDEGRYIGRIAAFFDHTANDYWKELVGLFGSYECPEDISASKLLLSTAKRWLRERGMKKMRGPWSFSSQEWGTVIDGFSPAPVILAPYNPSWHSKQIEMFGLKKIKDLLVFYADPKEGYEIPERFPSFSEMIRRKYGVSIRTLDKRRLKRDVQNLVHLTNVSIAGNWGYYPVKDDEAEAIAESLRTIVDPDMIFIAEDQSANPVGFAMSLPDINQLLRPLKGSLLPFGWLRLLIGMRHISQFRMWGLGVVPAYQGKAIDVLLYLATYEELKKRKARLEINYVLEDNFRMLNALNRLNVKPLRRYRVYETDL
jgi:ribosomal protein S18 acetylase RimI-like enzyme